MVFIKALVSIMALCALGVTAKSSAVAESSHLEARAKELEEPTIYYCEHTHWRGERHTATVPTGTCHSVPSEWNNRISSIRNENPVKFERTWYTDYDSEGDAYNDAFDEDLDDPFHDAISSYSCRKRG